MKLSDFPLLADQNIHADVVSFLRGAGFDIIDVQQSGWSGEDDASILAHAVSHGRVIFTHDADFGMLAIQAGAPYIGIVHLRPGHIAPQATIDSVRQLLTLDAELIPPFILTVKRVGQSVTVRIRHAMPS